MDKEIEKKRVLIVEDATTRLKKIVFDGMMLGQSKTYLKQQAVNLINETEKKLKEIDTDTDFITSVKLALQQSFLRWYYQVITTLKKVEKKDNLGIVSKTIKQLESSVQIKEGTDAFVVGGSQDNAVVGKTEITNLREYMTIYEEGGLGRYVDYGSIIKKNIVDITGEINEGSLSLTDSLGRKKSIRNMAEIKARYDLITDDLKKIKASGVQYVVATAHANASERCSWWQGKIFLIDLDLATREMGQYGGVKPKQTILGYIDSKPYYSLKEACENGFLSYNCQHRLVKYYKGVHIPKYNIVEVNRKRQLSQKQRYLENMIRKKKMAEVNAITPQDRQQAINESKAYQEEYKNFCEANNLTYYEWRTRITIEERKFHPDIGANTDIDFGNIDLPNDTNDDIIEETPRYTTYNMAKILENYQGNDKIVSKALENASLDNETLTILNNINKLNKVTIIKGKSAYFATSITGERIISLTNSKNVNTFYHEFGHSLDCLIAYDDAYERDGRKFQWLSSDLTEARVKMKEEWDGNIPSEIIDVMDSENKKAIDYVTTNYIDTGIVNEKIQKEIQKSYSNYNSLPPQIKRSIFNSIANKIVSKYIVEYQSNNEAYTRWACFSDICDAVTSGTAKNSKSLIAKHGYSYYAESGLIQASTAGVVTKENTEIFANYVEMRMGGYTEQLDMLKKTMPKLYEALERTYKKAAQLLEESNGSKN